VNPSNTIGYALFLDDERMPSEVTWVELPKVDWVIVRTVDAFAAMLAERGRPSFVSFDNDLQQVLEGNHASRILCDLCIDNRWKIPQWFVHSQNNQGVALIVSHFESLAKAWPELV
jgi:hypothetical protein